MKQREIKFRAMRDDMNPSWVYGSLLYGGDIPRIQELPLFNLFTTCLKGTDGQFTGLQDKNGKDIYEGDVVEAKSWSPMRYAVEFIEGGFCFTHPKLKESPIDVNLMYSSVGCACEVIGNVFEHPELLPTNTTEGR